MPLPPQRHGPASPDDTSAPSTPQDPGVVNISASMTESNPRVAMDTIGTTGPTARSTTTAAAGTLPPARRGSSTSTTARGSSPDADMDGSTVVEPDEALSDPDGDGVDEQHKRQAAKNGKAVWTRYCDVQPLTRPAPAAAAPAPVKLSTNGSGGGGGGGGGYYDVEADEKARRDWESAQEREMERWALGSMIDCGWED